MSPSHRWHHPRPATGAAEGTGQPAGLPRNGRDPTASLPAQQPPAIAALTAAPRGLAARCCCRQPGAVVRPAQSGKRCSRWSSPWRTPLPPLSTKRSQGNSMRSASLRAQAAPRGGRWDWKPEKSAETPVPMERRGRRVE